MPLGTQELNHALQDICYQAIGIIYSPFTDPKGTPIQPKAAEGVDGVVEVFPEFAEGLQDIDGFSHLILLYHFHLVKPGPLRAKPFMDTKKRGVFAMRSPRRPNPIGLSIVRLVQIKGTRLSVQDVDIVNGTPLLDIKPYVPAFDVRPADRIGWLTEQVQKLPESRDNGRFTDDT
jgi:tRNA-Thr(GGU) m(6)t(6)A37 methyltransferase TsaA